MYVLVRAAWVYSKAKYIPFRVSKGARAYGETGVIEFVRRTRSDKINGGGMVEYWVARVVSGNVKVGDKFSFGKLELLFVPETVFPSIEVVEIVG